MIDCKTVRIFAYSSTREQSNKRSATKLKTESEACEARALRARKTLTPRFTDFFTDFEKKTDCFAVYMYEGKRNGLSPHISPFFLLITIISGCQGVVTLF